MKLSQLTQGIAFFLGLFLCANGHANLRGYESGKPFSFVSKNDKKDSMPKDIQALQQKLIKRFALAVVLVTATNTQASLPLGPEPLSPKRLLGPKKVVVMDQASELKKKSPKRKTQTLPVKKEQVAHPMHSMTPHSPKGQEKALPLEEVTSFAQTLSFDEKTQGFDDLFEPQFYEYPDHSCSGYSLQAVHQEGTHQDPLKETHSHMSHLLFQRVSQTLQKMLQKSGTYVANGKPFSQEMVAFQEFFGLKGDIQEDIQNRQNKSSQKTKRENIQKSTQKQKVSYLLPYEIFDPQTPLKDIQFENVSHQKVGSEQRGWKKGWHEKFLPLLFWSSFDETQKSSQKVPMLRHNSFSFLLREKTQHVYSQDAAILFGHLPQGCHVTLSPFGEESVSRLSDFSFQNHENESFFFFVNERPGSKVLHMECVSLGGDQQIFQTAVVAPALGAVATYINLKDLEYHATLKGVLKRKNHKQSVLRLLGQDVFAVPDGNDTFLLENFFVPKGYPVFLALQGLEEGNFQQDNRQQFRVCLKDLKSSPFVLNVLPEDKKRSYFHSIEGGLSDQTAQIVGTGEGPFFVRSFNEMFFRPECYQVKKDQLVPVSSVDSFGEKEKTFVSIEIPTTSPAIVSLGEGEDVLVYPRKQESLIFLKQRKQLKKPRVAS